MHELFLCRSFDRSVHQIENHTDEHGTLERHPVFVVGTHARGTDRASVSGRTWALPHQVCLFRHGSHIAVAINPQDDTRHRGDRAKVKQTVRKLPTDFKFGAKSSLGALRAVIFDALMAEKPRNR